MKGNPGLYKHRTAHLDKVRATQKAAQKAKPPNIIRNEFTGESNENEEDEEDGEDEEDEVSVTRTLLRIPSNDNSQVEDN